MKVLHLSNFSSPRCGIRNFGDQMSTALRLAGATVVDWDIQYSRLYELVQRNEPAYLPPDVMSFDVVHYNWHPVTSNHYGPGHFPWQQGAKPIVSVYLNDIPPFSGCPFHDRADVRFTAEPSPGCIEIPYPIADWVTDLPPTTPDFTLGIATVRGDGIALVREIAAGRNWRVIEPDRSGWLSFEEAVRHQAQPTVNVQWYHEGRGKSGGASQAIASRRPVLLNDSPMFTHLAGYQDLYWGGEDLDAALLRIHADWQAGTLIYPDAVIRDRGWVSWGAPAFLKAWEAHV